MKHEHLRSGLAVCFLIAALGIGACDDASQSQSGKHDCTGDDCAEKCGGEICGDGQTCLNDACVYSACVENGVLKVCGDGQVCDSTGACEETACIGKSCESGLVCSQGECVDPACLDKACDGGKVCDKGVCVFEACVGKDACTGGKVCDESGNCVREGDAPALLVDSSDRETDEFGETGEFTVSLNHAPSADVTLTCTVEPAEASVDCSGVRLNAENYSMAQQVIVTGLADNVVDGDQAFTVKLTTVSDDAEFNGLNAAVEMMNRDMDKAEVIVNTEGEYYTSESGAQIAFTVVLGTKPTAEVRIPVSSSNTGYGTIDGADQQGTLVLVFTPDNWDKPQTVTVTGQEDGLVINESAHVYQVIFAKTESEDAHYNGLELDPISITNQDNDKAGVYVNAESVKTSENGEPVELRVSLGLAPEKPVTVTVELFDEDGVSQTEVVTEAEIVGEHSIVLEASSSLEGLPIQIAGLADNIIDGDQNYTVVLSFSSEDKNYGSLENLVLKAVNVDTDTAGVIASVDGSPTLAEGSEETIAVNVTLASIPTDTVTVTLDLSNDAEMTVSPATLEFTPENWNVPQVVTAASVDDQVVDGDQDVKIRFKAASSDTNFDGSMGQLMVTVTDNDTAALIVEGNSADLREESGDKVTFTVKLSAEPVDDVVVKMKSSDETELKLSSASSIAFTSENWNVPQTVELVVVDDSLKDGTQTAHISLTSSSGDDVFSELVAESPEYNIIDNDTATVTLSLSQNAVMAGDQTELSVTLSSKPTGNVVISLAGENGFVSFDSDVLTFTPSDWDKTQKVVVTTKGTQEDGAAIPESITAKSTGEGAYDDIAITPISLNIYTFEDKVFNYTGSVQSVQLPPGTFKLTVYGAQGATPKAEFTGGKGAVVSGILKLQSKTTVYVYVGGVGLTSGAGGWNGGGSTHSSSYGTLAAGGGGATDISLKPASGDGTVWRDDAHLCSRIIVAGAGGGGLHYTNEGGTGAIGGDGGAWNGANGQKVSGTDPGYGGTLSAGGNHGALAYMDAYSYAFVASGFGFGGTQTSNNESMGAGGGGWYGGGSGTWSGQNGSGGGGSSYAWTNQVTVDDKTLDKYYPSSCSAHAPSSDYLLTGVTAQAGTRTGNGYATIQLVK
ncbi:MAG: hypothetical protein IKY83_10090 [Proteobacteria bacterium]|nr:hypothetical protein [Pseudomonadota bacterium]